MSHQPETEAAYRERIAAIHTDLGIPPDYELTSGLALQQEPPVAPSAPNHKSSHSHRGGRNSRG